MSQGIQNARITSTTLGVEDHGIFTAWLMLDYGGSCQGFGGWALDGKPERRDGKMGERPGTAYGCEYILRVLRTLEVESWEKLKGAYCRVEVEQGRAVAIGHFLKDKWFDPQKLSREHFGEHDL